MKRDRKYVTPALCAGLAIFMLWLRANPGQRPEYGRSAARWEMLNSIGFGWVALAFATAACVALVRDIVDPPE